MAEQEGPNDEPKISKKAAKKAAQKAVKAEKKAENAFKKASEPQEPKKEKDKPQDTTTDTHVDPMESCFRVGWLKDVYDIKPVGDGVTTRFPPEPNGFLHIGHAKAIAVNFGFAKFHGGKCYLRYDDTNPAAEKELYFDSIRETVEWLGYSPYQITYSSDHFDRLYDLAETLVKKGKAYVCHCTQEDIVDQKGGKDRHGERFECPHRNRSTDQSLQELRDMKNDKYEPKEAVLRMKQDLLGSGNPQMWDLPAYRIVDRKDRHHHRTYDKWCIYPTYDFTHCLCDAFETISHSLCTTEFRTARESYDWLIDQLKDELPAVPQQREYGRLNVGGTVLSKRKIMKLVDMELVRGWDDPRLDTLIALRRRGIPPGAIRAFVADLGVSDSLSFIQLVKLETVVRKYLERTVPRLMLIPDPIPVLIDNLPEDYHEDISLPFMRGDESMGSHVVPFTRKVYIDRSDFRESDAADFFRLAPGKAVGLLNVPYPIRATSFKKDEATGLVTEIHASYEKPADGGSLKEKPKAFIQWVADSPERGSPIKAEVRIFNALFQSENPDSVEGGFLNDINPNSEEVFPNAVIETGFKEVRRDAPWPKDHVPNMHPGNWDVRFQGMRVAYFALDKESPDDKVILNKIVSLKEDVGKTVPIRDSHKING